MRKNKVFTIPNMLSFFRILLIPVIVWLYSTKKGGAAAAVVLVSGITDMLDGHIARKYNMISNVGKILDPIADKLTQAALILLLIQRSPWMPTLILLFAGKEVLQAVLGYMASHQNRTVYGAQWYGKLGTIVLYAVLLAMFLFPQMEAQSVEILIAVAALAILLSCVLYCRFFGEQLHGKITDSLLRSTGKRILEAALILLWVGLIWLCIRNKDKLTVDGIIALTPSNMVLAALLMLFMFLIKGLTIVIYGGILYATCGLLFPLPLAIFLNLVGTVLMVTLPYYIGKKTGTGAVKKIVKAYPKLVALQEEREKSDFFFSYIVRMSGIFPSDPLGLYMGAVGMKYKPYIGGAVLGMLPSVITFPIMGGNIGNIMSPAFIISAVCQLVITVLSLIIYAYIRRKRKKDGMRQ